MRCLLSQAIQGREAPQCINPTFGMMPSSKTLSQAGRIADERVRGAEEAPRAALVQALGQAPEAVLVDLRERGLDDHGGALDALERGRVGWSRGSPAATRTSRVADAPVAAAVQTKIGPRKDRLRAHTGTAVEASRTPA